MSFNNRIKSTLNISNLKVFISLIFLIFLFFTSFNLLEAEAMNQKNSEDSIEVVANDSVNIGSTISLKIRRSSEKDLPKVYFNKTKIPVFVLSDSWFRSLIPISADCKVGKHELEIFYLGKVKRKDLLVKETKYPLEELTLTKEVSALKVSKIERALVAKALSTESENKLWSGQFILPSTARQSTGYGVKRKVNGVINPDYFHKGLDFAAQTGANIKSPENGKVVLVGLVSKGFVVNGNCIFIDHGHGVVTGYLHLSSVLVKEGDLVKKGQIIGKVGSTGIASGPHLHWGVYVLGKTVDPLGWTNTLIE